MNSTYQKKPFLANGFFFNKKTIREDFDIVWISQ